jgi:hypothetical protein
MKFFRPSMFFIVLVLVTVLALNDRIMYILSPSTPFIFNLDTKPVVPVKYLDETNSKVLALDKNTIGVYSTKDNTFLLKEIFQTAGTPYYIADKLSDLNGTSIIFLDLDIDNPDALDKDDVTFLYDFVKNGGTLIGNEVLSARFGVLKELFGYKKYIPSKKHTQLILKKSNFFKYLDSKEEQKYTISNINVSPYTNSIVLGSAKPLAVYDDDTTALSINKYGKGEAINIGISLYDLRYRNLVDKDFNANAGYINSFEPFSDFILMLVKGIYETKLAHSISLHTAPNNNQASIILTHDIETEADLKNINKFIATEKNFNVTSTCFINVKYLADNKIDAFFKPKNFPYITNLQQHGVDIGVLAKPINRSFFLLPYGTCNESYPLYQKFGLSDLNNSKATLCGELKVSKELLQGIGIKGIVDFRSSGLIYNKKLPLAMEALGYRYASTFSAEDVLSYFPYRYPQDYDNINRESKIWEVPVSLDDSSIVPMYVKTKSYISLFKKIYDNGAVFDMKISPDKKKYLDNLFIEKFYKNIPSDVWKCTLKQFGDFWDKRDRIIFRYQIQKSKLILHIYSPIDVENITFKTNNLKLSEQYGIKVYKDKFTLDVKKGINTWTLNIVE